MKTISSKIISITAIIVLDILSFVNLYRFVNSIYWFDSLANNLITSFTISCVFIAVPALLALYIDVSPKALKIFNRIMAISVILLPIFIFGLSVVNTYFFHLICLGVVPAFTPAIQFLLTANFCTSCAAETDKSDVGDVYDFIDEVS